MSGFMRKAALVVGAVALVATTAGLAAPAVAATATTAATAGGVAGISAATLAAIGTYGGLAAGVLSAVSAATAPGMSNQGSATSFQTNPQSGLPYAIGRTRMSGLRFFADTNTRPGYTKFNDLLWFGALLSIGGQIEQIERFTIDNEVVTFDGSGNAVGNYRDYQGQKLHLGGPQASALALTLGGGAAPGWTPQHRLSGITHAMWALRYNKEGEMYGAGAPEPAWIGKWVRVYDPRLDSTYPGGSGPCRALNEATYVWSQNPGLHALTWALGRWQNSKRTCGIGAPVSTIRIGDFVECANVCDANAWKVGGVEWTTDSKWDTLKRILQAGGARPTKTGAMIGCMVSTPRTAIATIESRHLLDGLSIAATKSRRDRFNSVIPRYVDEDSDWSVISGTAITVPEYVTADKGHRTKEIDYPLVQVFSGETAMQPGQLAAYDIVNSREAGPITFTTGPEWIGLKTGDVVLLNVPEEGLANQPVLITRRAPDPSTGKVSFAAETETYSKHAYALGQSTTPPAPFSLSAPDLKPPAPSATAWAVSGTTSGEGFPALIVTGDSEMPSADAIVIDYRKSTDTEWSNSAILSAVEPVIHVIAPLASETEYDVRIGYRVGTIDGVYTIFTGVMTGLGKITIIEQQIVDQDALIAQLEADTAQAMLDIAAASTTITNIQTEVEGLADEVLAAVGVVETFEETLGTQGAAITTLQTTADTQAGQLASVETSLTTANASIATNASAISGLTSSVSTLSSTVSTLGASVSTNATAITALQGNVATLTTRVSSASPNLAPNGGMENGLAGYYYNIAGWTVANDNGWGAYAINTTNWTSGDSVLDTPFFPVYPGMECTGTADIAYQMISGSGQVRLELNWYNTADTLLGVTYGATIASGRPFDSSGQNRRDFMVSGAAPSGSTKAKLRAFFSKNSGAVVFQAALRQIKVERGLVATTYSAEASIVQSFSALSTLTTQYASLSTTVSTQGVTVSSHSTAITTINGNVTTLFAQAGVNLDVDGFVSGWKLNNNGAAGDMIVNVDRFAVGRKVSGSNVYDYPFQMIGSTTYIKNAMIQNAAITNAKIGDLEVGTLKIAGGAITANQVATAADISVSTSATVTFLETGWMTVGDGTYSQALVNVNFTLDGAVFDQFDAAGQLRLYIDAGTGYYEARRQTLGVSTNDGDSYWRMAGQLQTVVSAVSIRVKAECTSGAFIQSSVDRQLYVRDIVMTLLGAKR